MSEYVAYSGGHVELMGARFVSFDPSSETITLRFTVPDSFITPRGGVQGGLVAGFLDELMGWALVRASEGREAPLNLEIAMSLVKLVPPGEIWGTGRVVRRGKRVAFLEAELFNAANELVARATSTALVGPVPQGESAQ